METTNFNELMRSWEPGWASRFIIQVTGTEIPVNLFRGYKLYNDGDQLILETEFLESIEFTFNPKEFFNITDVEIQRLDPTGFIYSRIQFQVKGSNYLQTGNYASDELLINELKFIANPKTIKVVLENIANYEGPNDQKLNDNKSSE